MKPAVFVTDLHLTDQRQEAYRFNLFPLLVEVVKHYALHYVFILGDLTDKTDRHSAFLVNTLTTHLQAFSKLDCKVFILRGNHDYVDPACPYFKFLSIMSHVHYINEPTRVNLDGERVLMLPHTRHPEEDWKTLPLRDADIIFMHQTIKGSVSENGTPLDGMTMEALLGCKEIYSGDVHVPQRIGNLTYVGSPYHVHFGDTFKPRMLLRASASVKEDLQVELPSRHMFNIISVDDFKTREFKSGDQAKVIMHLTPDQWAMWPTYREAIKQYAQEQGLEIFDIQPQALGTASAKADTPTFLIQQQSSKSVVERFIKAKYPALHVSYMERGMEYVKQVDGV